MCLKPNTWTHWQNEQRQMLCHHLLMRDHHLLTCASIPLPWTRNESLLSFFPQLMLVVGGAPQKWAFLYDDIWV
jgi:hypothetical protein